MSSVLTGLFENCSCHYTWTSGSEIDSRIKDTLRRFADDTHLFGAVHIVEGKGVIQRELGQCKPHEVQQEECKVLHLSLGNPEYT